MKSFKSDAIGLPSVVEDGVCHVLAIVGGGKKAAAEHWERARADATMHFDNPTEISALREELGDQGNKYFFPLAEGETADTLSRFGSDVQRTLIESRGSMNASSGLGQIPGVGFLAGKLLEQSEEFQRFLRWLRDLVAICTFGRPLKLVIRLLGSTAGGTAAGMLETIARLLESALKIAGVNCEVQIDVIDGTTFLGLGERCGRNSAATITELAGYCYSKDGKPRDGVTRTLSVMALPPFRHDAASRYQLVALDEQAIMCREMQSLLALIRPNHALDGPLGVIEYRQVDFFRTLDSETEVANEVAHAYLPVLDDALKSAMVDKGLLEDLFTETSATPAVRQSIEDVLEDLLVLTEEDLVYRIERPAENLKCSAYAETARGERYLLERIDEEFQSPPATLSLAINRLSMLRTIERSLQDEIAMVLESLQGLEEVYDYERHIFEKALRRVRYPRIWHLTSSTRRWNRLVRAAHGLRSARDAMRPTQAILGALQTSLAVVQRVLDTHLRHVEGIHRAMQLFRPRGHAVPTDRSVEIRDIDDAFSELSLLPGANRSRQTRILSRQVVFVTLHGLSRVLQIDEPRLDLIVDRIIHGPPMHVGPYPGASRHKDGGKLVFSLPPMMPVPRRELKDLLQQRMPNATVVFADFAGAGINVLRYRFFRPHKVSELFPGMLERDLLDAISDELKPLYFPHGDERLLTLGLPTQVPPNATMKAGSISQTEHPATTT